ncbi:MAG: hypothetical protein SFY69_07860 [Planctomycetota bacterium]|nr:hypothetical protein [Planctomycetota bacterium]
MTAASVQPCVRCGNGAGTRLDTKGRPWCDACWSASATVAPRQAPDAPASPVRPDAGGQRQSAAPARPRPKAPNEATSAGEPRREPANAPAAGTTGHADDVLQLSDDTFAGKSRAPCPKCGAAMRPGVPACVCGFNPAALPLDPEKVRQILGDFDPDATPADQRRPKKAKPAPAVAQPTCGACGYVLTGVPTSAQGDVTCPECGTTKRLSYRKPEYDELSAEVARWSVLRPVFMIAGGLLVVVGVMFANGWVQGGIRGAALGWVRPPGQRGLGVAGPLVLGGLLVYAWATLVAFGVTALLGVMWTGVSTTFRKMLLNVAGLVAVALAIRVTVDLIPLPIPWWATGMVCGVIYAWYLADMQDLDLQESAIVTFCTALLVWVTLAIFSLML